MLTTFSLSRLAIVIFNSFFLGKNTLGPWINNWNFLLWSPELKAAHTMTAWNSPIKSKSQKKCALLVFIDSSILFTSTKGTRRRMSNTQVSFTSFCWKISLHHISKNTPSYKGVWKKYIFLPLWEIMHKMDASKLHASFSSARSFTQVTS